MDPLHARITNLTDPTDPASAAPDIAAQRLHRICWNLSFFKVAFSALNERQIICADG
jgi:hypothetical protein